MADKQLNAAQLEAITHGDGPLLIIAGAGTGKTTVITERVKWLISQNKANCDEILALTFTEKAAREMEERIDIALPYGFTELSVSTFHSFCDRILRDEAINIGLNPNYKLLSTTDATDLLKKHLFSLDLDYYRPLGNPYKFIAGILQYLSRLKDEDVSITQHQSWSNTLPQDTPENQLEYRRFQELSRIYQTYEDIKVKQGFMDFGDLISYCLVLFRTRPNLLKKYQQKFKYILVDEYQDTNYAQNQLVNLLASSSHNLTVVADDDQSIYRWRGAAVSNVLQFKSTYPDAKLVVLTQNYRSTQEILNRSYGLIQHNNPDRLEVKEKIDKHLTAIRKTKGVPVKFLHFDRVENEADAVAKEIAQLITHHPSLSYKDFAILVRANAHADPFMHALSRHGIPYQFLGPAQLFHQPEIKDLIAYLRILNDFNDDPSFYRVLCMDFFQISPRDIIALTSSAKRLNLHLFTACEQISQFPVSEDTKTKITQLVNIISRHLSLVSKVTGGQILFDFLNDTGMLSAILNYQLPLDAKKAKNITLFFNKLKSYEATHQESFVPQIVEWLDLSMEIGESPAATDTDWSENDAVNILTIHSAKGLEFSVVFLVNLVSQRFPSTQKAEIIPLPDALIKEDLPQGDFHLQEERRLFYVGITRARDNLYLTAADYYGEGKRTKKLSPFIAETLGEKFIDQKVPISDQLSLLDWQKSPSPILITPNPSPVIVNYLSYSQIQTFIDCPLHYKAKYILKIPTPPGAAASFGTTIHLTLKQFYEIFSREGKADIQDIYRQCWIPEGYIDTHQSQLYFKKGQAYLDQYLLTSFDPAHLPVKLEDTFNINLGPLKIGGKIDRVDLLPDGKIEIIDYKTSTKFLTAKEAQTDLQLSFYALAATLLPMAPFHKDPSQVVLSLYYLDEQKKVTTTRTAQDLVFAKEQIFQYAKDIATSDFACSGSPFCKKCDYHMLCDLNTVSDRPTPTYVSSGVEDRETAKTLLKVGET